MVCTTLMTVRANVDLQKPTVYKDNIKAINNICSGEKSTLDSPAQVKLVTADGEDKISFDNGCYYANGEKMIKYSEHQVLLTAQANSGGGKSSCRGKGKNRVGNAGKGRHQ